MKNKNILIMSLSSLFVIGLFIIFASIQSAYVNEFDKYYMLEDGECIGYEIIEGVNVENSYSTKVECVGQVVLDRILNNENPEDIDVEGFNITVGALQ